MLQGSSSILKARFHSEATVEVVRTNRQVKVGNPKEESCLSDSSTLPYSADSACQALLVGLQAQVKQIGLPVLPGIEASNSDLACSSASKLNYTVVLTST